jgi:nucleotide-binding universal stress UspA family protein
MRILMPVDGSEYSKSSVAFVASRTTLLKTPTEVELVNIQYPVPPRAARALGREMVHSFHEAEAAKALRSTVATLKRAGANATARYVVGNVARELTSIVANDRADLIVMGSHGDTGLKKLLLGSVASAVALSCTKPLLIMRGAAMNKRDSLKVGIALDGSPYGLAVARFVASNRDLFGASPSVSLIHVVPDLTKITVPGWIEREVPTGIKPEKGNAMQMAAFENVFKPAHELLARVGITAGEVRLIGADPGASIAAQAGKSRWDVLAMGSLGFGTARHTLMGSVASRVASRCKTALLLVREK